MFNYFWLFVIVVLVACFLIYTILAIKDILEDYYLYGFEDFWLVFLDDHPLLTFIWIGIIIIAAIVSFKKWEVAKGLIINLIFTK